jgi:hypothetical protein
MRTSSCGETFVPNSEQLRLGDTSFINKFVSFSTGAIPSFSYEFIEAF